MHDLAIRNALICDGTGAKIYLGEIAVADGVISEIDTKVGPAREDIDAGGQVVAPGIIDNHTHYDAQITWDPFASPSLGLGVTTLLMGNCGFTIAPCRSGDRELILKNLTQVEGMSLDALLEGTRSEYETFSDYMGMLETLGVVPNVAVYCGHSSIRNWVSRCSGRGRHRFFHLDFRGPQWLGRYTHALAVRGQSRVGSLGRCSW
jgi:N-acyl-D-aspartate/D-glutamate deacylase